MKQKIRITAPGIYGLPPSEEHPSGEYPIGHEFTTDRELPEGWKGKYHVLERFDDDGELIVNEGEGGEPGPLDGSIADLTAHLKGVDDADEVQRLIDAETAGKSRSGALAALEARRDELLA